MTSVEKRYDDSYNSFLQELCQNTDLPNETSNILNTYWTFTKTLVTDGVEIQSKACYRISAFANSLFKLTGLDEASRLLGNIQKECSDTTYYKVRTYLLIAFLKRIHPVEMINRLLMVIPTPESQFKITKLIQEIPQEDQPLAITSMIRLVKGAKNPTGILSTLDLVLPELRTVKLRFTLPLIKDSDDDTTRKAIFSEMIKLDGKELKRVSKQAVEQLQEMSKEERISKLSKFVSDSLSEVAYI